MTAPGAGLRAWVDGAGELVTEDALFREWLEAVARHYGAFEIREAGETMGAAFDGWLELEIAARGLELVRCG